MEQKYYDTAVFGATFLGLGAALRLENVIVIEKGGVFGAEFVNSYRVCEKKAAELKTELGNDFWRNLKSRGLVSETGDIYPAPAVYVLSAYLKEKPMDILLMTEVTDIKRIDGYYQITVYHAGGSETIFAKRLIDTTTFGIRHDGAKGRHFKQFLNAIMYNPENKEVDGLSFNPLNGFYTYTMPVPLGISRPEALEMLCEKAPLFLKNRLRISSIASDFAYTVQPFSEVIGDGYLYIPSTAYPNLMEAFDRGVQAAEEGWV